MKYSPMLCRKEPYNRLKKNLDNYISSIKFDGQRCLAYISENGDYKLINRRGHNITHKFPELEFPKRNMVLDGEVVVLEDGRSDYSKTMTRSQTENSMKIRVLSKRYPATFMVFDILFRMDGGGQELTDLPLMERKKILEREVTETENVKLVDYYDDEEEIRELWERVKEEGLEGIVLKNKKSKYRCGVRSGWLKVKTLNSMEAEIVGYRKSKKNRPFRSLVLSEDGEYKGRCGSGFSDNKLKKLKKKLDKIRVDKAKFEEIDEKYDIVWVKPNKLKCQTKYLEETKGGKLRHPRFLKIVE